MCMLLPAVTLLIGTLLAQSPDVPAASVATFPAPVNTERDAQSRPLAPADAAQAFQRPDGFQVTVFAAEPDVQNPIAMDWDHRGRLWIAENYTYADATRKFELSLRDRILILEDSDGDGCHDRRSVFTEDLQMLAGVATGRGGVWVLCPPQLLFIPDRDGNDVPDAAPEVVLDGFTPATDNHHTFANGLKWGPDGWLYGRCGASSPGRVGVPGTEDSNRVPLFGGVWRFRPRSPGVEARFEVMCHGTTNPWGMDWTATGEAFFVNTVNGHLWHVIPGAHFRRPHSEDPNPAVYETIDTHADHYHWDTGKNWTDSRNVTGEHDRLGGGHAHSGAMIYLGDNWPESFRGRLMTLNLHGRRVNQDRLEVEGSGFTGRHESDLLQSGDPWFRGIDLSYGPCGSVFILDWSDTGECHEHTGVHRTSGRIYRVSRGVPERNSADLARLSSGTPEDLIALLGHSNEWFARQARLRMRDLAHTTWDDQTRSRAETQLRVSRDSVTKSPLRWRALTTLSAIGGLTPRDVQSELQHADPAIRVWAIRELTDAWPLDTIFGAVHPDQARLSLDETILRDLLSHAQRDDSPRIRLALASVLQRLPLNRRLELASHLASHAEDANDHNLPLMVWYGLMPLASGDPAGLAEFALRCRWPQTRRLVARQLAEHARKNPRAIEILLRDPAPLDLLEGLAEGFAGQSRVASPTGWTRVQDWASQGTSERARELVRDLSVLFGDGRALDEVRRIALDPRADLATRRTALRTLIDARAPDRRFVCEELLTVRYLNTTAVQGLTEFNDPVIGEKLAQNYRRFFPSDRPAVVEALVSRPEFARSLLDHMAAGKINRGELSAAQARQIRSFSNAELTQRLVDAWGETRDSPDDKRQQIERLRQQITPETLAQSDPRDGRAIFNRLCANCHRLYGHGGQIGPDLTGSGRRELDYNLLNLIDPSATVGAEYRMSIVILKDGRVLNGIIASRTASTVVLQTPRERLTLPADAIDEIQPSAQSLMPEGQLQMLTDEQTRNLIAYLMSATQVPLPD